MKAKCFLRLGNTCLAHSWLQYAVNLVANRLPGRAVFVLISAEGVESGQRLYEYELAQLPLWEMGGKSLGWGQLVS